MTEPMKTFEQLYLDWSNSTIAISPERFMYDYGVSQVSAERERIIEKMKARVRDDFDLSRVTTLQDLYDLIREA